jgi:hypothetical protein
MSFELKIIVIIIVMALTAVECKIHYDKSIADAEAMEKLDDKEGEVVHEVDTDSLSKLVHDNNAELDSTRGK